MTNSKSQNNNVSKIISPKSQLLFLKEYQETRVALAIIRVLFMCMILGLIWIICVAYHPPVSASTNPYQLSPEEIATFINQLIEQK